MKKLDALEKHDADFLKNIATLAGISLDALHNILYLSDADYVEWPIDDSEYEDINEGYEEKYDWVDDGPLRLSKYGSDVDLQMPRLGSEFNTSVVNGRLISLTIDFSLRNVEDPTKLFEAFKSAIQRFSGNLVLESLCLCALQNNIDNFCNLHTDLIAIELSDFEVRLPYLKHLCLNRVTFSSINFFAAPRLQSISILESNIDAYDFSRMIALEEICIGDLTLRKITLPPNGALKKIIVGKGMSPSVRERTQGIGCDLGELILNIGFSLEYLSVVGCGVSKIDLSIMSNLKYLNLEDNPIAELNLSWVPNLEFLKLQGTGINNVDTTSLIKISVL
jgi:hypothetical protein